MPTHPKRPGDPNQLAKLIVGIPVGAGDSSNPQLSTPAHELARSGGYRHGAFLEGGQSPQRPQTAPAPSDITAFPLRYPTDTAQGSDG